MQIIRNDGRCEAVSAKLQNGELILEQGHDVILLPIDLADALICGLTDVAHPRLASARSARQAQADSEAGNEA